MWLHVKHITSLLWETLLLCQICNEGNAVIEQLTIWLIWTWDCVWNRQHTIRPYYILEEKQHTIMAYCSHEAHTRHIWTNMWKTSHVMKPCVNQVNWPWSKICLHITEQKVVLWNVILKHNAKIRKCFWTSNLKLWFVTYSIHTQIIGIFQPCWSLAYVISEIHYKKTQHELFHCIAHVMCFAILYFSKTLPWIKKAAVPAVQLCARELIVPTRSSPP